MKPMKKCFLPLLTLLSIASGCSMMKRNQTMGIPSPGIIVYAETPVPERYPIIITLKTRNRIADIFYQPQGGYGLIGEYTIEGDTLTVYPRIYYYREYYRRDKGGFKYSQMDSLKTIPERFILRDNEIIDVLDTELLEEDDRVVPNNYIKVYPRQ